MSHQNFSSKCLIKMPHQNAKSKCLITMSHKNFSSKCLIKMYQQNVSSSCTFSNFCTFCTFYTFWSRSSSSSSTWYCPPGQVESFAGYRTVRVKVDLDPRYILFSYCYKKQNKKLIELNIVDFKQVLI